MLFEIGDRGTSGLFEIRGGGGRGELAWRFSGLGDPSRPTELEEDAGKQI